MFDIRFGKEKPFSFWNELKNKNENNTANKEEVKLYRKLVKALKLLQVNPRHNSLNSHEIDILSRRMGMKVFESYLENHKPAAGRIFWVYYPPGSITIIGLEKHPNDNKHSYEKIILSKIYDN